jgi:hypothetical protein
MHTNSINSNGLETKNRLSTHFKTSKTPKNLRNEETMWQGAHKGLVELYYEKKVGAKSTG